MIKKSEIDRFYTYVDSLGLKFPVAAISKATGFSKGQVSDYLNKNKEPSENFLNAFYEKFMDSSIKVPREKRGHLPEVAPVSDATSLSILIASNKALSDAALIQAEKDKINAEANKIREQKELNLVKNNTELTQAIRESTSRGSHDHPLSDPTVISNLLETLVALGMGSLWKTREEGLVSLGNKLALPENVIEMMVSTHADGGR